MTAAAEALTAEQRELVEQHMWMVKGMAIRRHRTARSVPVDELVSAGYWALVRYIPRYNPELGLLDRFVSYRVAKAMTDHCLKTRAEFQASFYSETFTLDSPVPSLTWEASLAATDADMVHSVVESLDIAGSSGFLGQLFSKSKSPEEEVLDKDMCLRLRKVIEEHLATMPPAVRRLFIAFFGDGRSIDEIATASGASPSTIDRALKSLRAELRRVCIEHGLVPGA